MSYQDFADKPASEKIALATVKASKRLMGWSVHSGSVYRISVGKDVIFSIEENQQEANQAESISAIVPLSYFHDRVTGVLYYRASDSSNPNTRFVVVTFNLFFSNFPVSLPNDLNDGFHVEWLPYISSTSIFGQELDNQNQLAAQRFARE